jgi:hypothetical protein
VRALMRRHLLGVLKKPLHVMARGVVCALRSLLAAAVAALVVFHLVTWEEYNDPPVAR